MEHPDSNGAATLEEVGENTLNNINYTRQHPGSEDVVQKDSPCSVNRSPEFTAQLNKRITELAEWLRQEITGPNALIEAERMVVTGLNRLLRNKCDSLGVEGFVDYHGLSEYGASPTPNSCESIQNIPVVSSPVSTTFSTELPDATIRVGESPRNSPRPIVLKRQGSEGSNLNSIVDTTVRKTDLILPEKDLLPAPRFRVSEITANTVHPHLPPGHFVSQVASSPKPLQRMRRTSSMPLEPDAPDEEGSFDLAGKRESVRVSLEGVAQLGQLLCRMMLFPIFRSNNEYLHWKKIFRTIVRIRLPDDCRRKVWTIVARRTIPPSACKTLLDSVADHDIMDLCVQIEKDLHRTSDNEYFQSTTGRATLARILLAYSQHNKEVGYCQSLNFIGAQLLLLMNKNEEDAFAALCVLVDQLPKNYFDDLEALAVDLLVFDELMKERLPRLHAHCRRLMKSDAQTYHYTFADEDPPLTSVFTGQWFPTLFTNLFPQDILFRVWDSILFDGDEMMFRVGLSIMTMLEPQLLGTKDTLRFYEQMKEHTSNMNLSNTIVCDDMIKLAYNMYPFPLPRLAELRTSMEKKRLDIKKTSHNIAVQNETSEFLQRFSVSRNGDESDK
eukprot:CFRG5934T1